MLKFLIFVFASAGCACGVEKILNNGLLPQLDHRIVGGESATINQFPYQASIRRSGSHSCGGAIYSQKIVITAAHCLQAVSEAVLTVQVGSSNWQTGGLVVGVESFKNHEDYNSSTMENDIALIRLNSSLYYSSTIRSIYVTSTAPSNGALAVVTGWGTTQMGYASLQNKLQMVEVNIIDISSCTSLEYGYGNKIKTSMICAAAVGKDSCQGDSGGPLVSGGLLVGIVSWGYGCAHPNYPGVYTNVAVFSNWIMNNS